MARAGYLKLHRKMIDWEWYHDINVCRVFVHLLMVANYEDGRWQGIEIKRGQHITSREKLARETTLSIQQVRTALNKLKSTNEITIKSTKTYTLITVVKYAEYQDMQPSINQDDNQQSNFQATKEQPSINQESTTIKEEKEEEEVKKKKKHIGADAPRKFIKPTVDEVKEYCEERMNGIDAQYFIDSNEAKGWLVGKTRTPMKDWKAVIRTWEQNRKEQGRASPNQNPYIAALQEMEDNP